MEALQALEAEWLKSAEMKEQFEALRAVAQSVADAKSYVSIDGRTVLADESLAERVDALRDVLRACEWGYTGDERTNCACPVCNPAKEPDA